MEVASPLTLGPSTVNKRSLLCSSPQLGSDRTAKRRRFHDTTVDSLSDDFSAHSLLFKSQQQNAVGQQQQQQPGIFSSGGGHLSALKRSRRLDTPPKKSAAEGELNRVIQEQASLIESLKKDKMGLEKSLASLENERNRAVKENTILRKAVSYQQERENNLENNAKTIKATADERIKALENMILTLRYHLQAQNTTIGNDFMSQRPPDVY